MHSNVCYLYLGRCLYCTKGGNKKCTPFLETSLETSDAILQLDGGPSKHLSCLLTVSLIYLMNSQLDN